MEVGDIVRITYHEDSRRVGLEGIYMGVLSNKNQQSWTDCHVKMHNDGRIITIETDCVAFVRKNTPIDKWLYG